MLGHRCTASRIRRLIGGRRSPAWHYGLAAARADRLSDFSWEFGCNALMLHVRFSLQLGEKRWDQRVNRGTLNQRVPGSSPGAPTKKIWARVCRENVKVTAEALFRVRQVCCSAGHPGTRRGTPRGRPGRRMGGLPCRGRVNWTAETALATPASGASTYPRILALAAQHDHAPAAAHPLGELGGAVFRGAAAGRHALEIGAGGAN